MTGHPERLRNSSLANGLRLRTLARLMASVQVIPVISRTTSRVEATESPCHMVGVVGWWLSFDGQHDLGRHHVQPIINFSARKVGGIMFIRLGFFCMSFCISRKEPGSFMTNPHSCGEA